MKTQLLEKIQGYRADQWSTFEIWEKSRLSQLNVNPPYQRSVVWNKEFQKNLIASIFSKYPIPHLTLVENEGNDGWIVLDGKQRIHSILSYYDNKIQVQHPDLENSSVSFSSLKKSDDKKYKMAFSEFKNAKMHVVILPSMPWLEQRDIFMILNHSVQLGTNEKTYCENFHAKSFFSWLCKETISKYPSLSKAKKFSARFNNLRFVHGILYKLYGDHLTDFQSVLSNGRSIDADRINESSGRIHDDLISISCRDTDEMSMDICKELKIDKNIETFVSVSRALKAVFERDGLNLKWNPLIVRDALMYFTDADYRNMFTTSQIREHESLIETVLRDYAIRISLNEAYKHATMNCSAINARLGELDAIFKSECKSHNIDLGLKRKVLSGDEKTRAMLASNGKCPIDGKFLTDDNCQIDHVSPKSKASVTVAVAICKECNLRKSNWSQEEFKKYSDYVEKYSQIIA